MKRAARRPRHGSGAWSPPALAVLLLVVAWADSPSAQPGTGAMQVSPATRSEDLASLPESRVLVFPNGLRMTVAQLRGLKPPPTPGAAASRPGNDALRPLAGGPVVDVRRSSSLVDLERASAGTRLRLPDGRSITAAQLAAVDEALARSGPPANARAQAGAANVASVPRGTPLAQMLARPDSDVLVSPNGTRITVGELRRYLAAGTSGPRK